MSDDSGCGWFEDPPTKPFLMVGARLAILAVRGVGKAKQRESFHPAIQSSKCKVHNRLVAIFILCWLIKSLPDATKFSLTNNF